MYYSRREDKSERDLGEETVFLSFLNIFIFGYKTPLLLSLSHRFYGYIQVCTSQELLLIFYMCEDFGALVNGVIAPSMMCESCVREKPQRGKPQGTNLSTKYWCSPDTHYKITDIVNKTLHGYIWPWSWFLCLYLAFHVDLELYIVFVRTSPIPQSSLRMWFTVRTHLHPRNLIPEYL